MKFQFRLCHAVYLLNCSDSSFVSVVILRKYLPLCSYKEAIREFTLKNCQSVKLYTIIQYFIRYNFILRKIQLRRAAIRTTSKSGLRT
jgi:hypothetical protein